MRSTLPVPLWTIGAPVVAWLLFFFKAVYFSNFFALVVAVALIVSVLAAGHHAEVIAHRIGEPYGTLVLAIAVTIIEVSLIVSLMLSGGPDTATLAWDTVFAAVMIILTGIMVYVSS